MTIYPSLRSSYWLLPILTSLVLSGCFDANIKDSQEQKSSTGSVLSTSDKMPDWVLFPPQDSSHIYGVGSAPKSDNVALSFEQAERNGNAQIAQQLRSQVSQINTQETHVSKQSGQDEKVTRIQSAYTRITTAPIELTNTVNEGRYASKGYVYVLQSINRTQIIAKLKHTIMTLDQSIKEQGHHLSTSLEQAPNSQDWHVYMQLIPLFAQRKQVMHDLSIYTKGAPSALLEDHAITSLETQTNNALMQFGFDTSDATSPDTLAGALSSFGLTPKTNSTFRLSSKTTQQTQIKQNRFYVFENGTLTLFGPNGDQLAAWTTTARGIATNKAMAQHQATMEWSNQAVKAMFAWLTK